MPRRVSLKMTVDFYVGVLGMRPVRPRPTDFPREQMRFVLGMFT